MTHNVLRARNYTPPPHYVKIYMQACTVAQVSTETKILHELHRNRVYCIVLRAETNGKQMLVSKRNANSKWKMAFNSDWNALHHFAWNLSKEISCTQPKILGISNIVSNIWKNSILFQYDYVNHRLYYYMILMHVNDFWNSVLRKWKLLTAKEKRAYNLSWIVYFSTPNMWNGCAPLCLPIKLDGYDGDAFQHK